MEPTMRQFLKDLIACFTATVEDTNTLVQFTLVENLVNDCYELSSSVCPFTLILVANLSPSDKVKNTMAYVVDKSEGLVDAVEAIVEGNPTVLLPFTTVNLRDSVTYDALFHALTSSHAFKAARYLLTFSNQCKSE